MSAHSWSFTVYGTPIPQGSTRAFIPKGWKRPVITADNRKTKPWRQEIAGVAMELNGVPWPIEKPMPVRLELRFTLAKPKSVPKHLVCPTKKPDLDKLARAVLDALSGIAFEDDSQVCELVASKCYGQPETLRVTLETI